MKINGNREQLLQAFSAVAPVAPTRSPMPILQSVKLDVTDAGATLLATDNEVSIRHSVSGVEVSATGAVLLPVGRFGSILRESSDATLLIESDGAKTLVRGERSRFNLPAENPAGFPSVADFDAESYYEAPARLLKEVIRRTIFATETESSRYALGGVKLEWADGVLIALGTDGRRLAKMECPVSAVGDPGTLGDATIVPARALTLIDRALTDDDAEVQFAVRQNELLVRSPKVVINARLLEGRYPRWREVLPQRNDSAKIDLLVGPFMAAVRQAMIVNTQDSRGVNFTFGAGNVMLNANVADAGDAHVELPIGYDGPEIAIKLDPRYLADFLKVLDSEKTFTFDVKDSDAAALATTDDGYSYVLMPLARDR